MLNEELRKFIKRIPFEAFEIEMVTGRVLSVTHPDWLLLPPIPKAPYFVWVDPQGIAEVLNTNLIVSVRPSKPGRGKRRKAS